MRMVIDLFDNVTTTIRVVVGLFVLGMIALGFLMTAGATVVAPVAVEQIGERAERLGEKAIEAQRERDRNRALAEDGWGYGAGSDSSSSDDDWGTTD